MKLSAILLAAGQSTRMGVANKLLLPLANKALVLYSIEALLATNIEELLLVTGFDKTSLEAEISRKDERLKLVYNPDFEKGMTSSIQAGVRAANTATDGFLICLADMPFLKAEDYNKMLLAFVETPQAAGKIFVPTFEERQGHPILFGTAFKQAILEHKNPNGCKAILEEHQEKIERVRFQYPAIFKDIDTPEKYQQALGGDCLL